MANEIYVFCGVDPSLECPQNCRRRLKRLKAICNAAKVFDAAPEEYSQDFRDIPEATVKEFIDRASNEEMELCVRKNEIKEAHQS